MLPQSPPPQVFISGRAAPLQITKTIIIIPIGQQNPIRLISPGGLFQQASSPAYRRPPGSSSDPAMAAVDTKGGGETRLQIQHINRQDAGSRSLLQIAAAPPSSARDMIAAACLQPDSNIPSPLQPPRRRQSPTQATRLSSSDVSVFQHYRRCFQSKTATCSSSGLDLRSHRLNPQAILTLASSTSNTAAE